MSTTRTLQPVAQAAPAPTTGGAPAPSTGGAPAPTTGGAPAPTTGGAPAPTTGGAPAPTTGGAPAAARRRVLAVAAQVRGAVADAAPSSAYQRTTYVVAAAFLLSGLVHVGVWAAEGGPWEGAVSWRKPILFGVSFGMFALAAGWVQGVLPRSRAWGWTTTVLMGAGGVAEVALITAQQWRGTASHFNVLTPFDALMFSLMGVTIAVFATGVLVLTVWAVLRLRRPAPTVIAVLVGLALVQAGSALGGDLMTRGLAYVEANEAVPAAVVLGVAGSGKLAHAVALHGLQVLGVLALLLGRSGLPPATRTRAMACAAAGYVGLTGVVTAHAYAGRSMLELTWPVSAALVVTTAAVLLPFGVALRDAVRR